MKGMKGDRSMREIAPGDRVRHVEVPFQTGTVDLIQGETVWVELDNNASRACFPADRLERL
jgi:hypothetical protein